METIGILVYDRVANHIVHYSTARVDSVAKSFSDAAVKGLSQRDFRVLRAALHRTTPGFSP